jgi:hypothetical protein
MVSYTRARAEGLSLDCKVGLMQRPERVEKAGGLRADIPAGTVTCAAVIDVPPS